MCVPGCVCAELPHVQNGRLPLHSAVANNAVLDVVEVLLQAYKHAAQVADEVCVEGGMACSALCM